jgi:hypothetical protein
MARRALGRWTFALIFALGIPLLFSFIDIVREYAFVVPGTTTVARGASSFTSRSGGGSGVGVSGGKGDRYRGGTDKIDGRGVGGRGSTEFRSRDDGTSFPGAREWYGNWSRISNHGGFSNTGSDDRDGESSSSSSMTEEEYHVHDERVAKLVELATASTVRHIDDMKDRYEAVGALPDHYARGIGWIRDVSYILVDIE